MKYTAVIAAVLLWSVGAWSSAGEQRQSDTFSEQAAQLIRSIMMPEEELAAVPGILHDLELALSTRWPDCQVKPFGSTVTGLALIDSDIDAYVLLPDRGSKSFKADNFKAVSVLKKFPDYAKIHPKLFLVTFQHIPSHTKIDLLFNNFEGVRNSALLRYFLNLDDRVRNLAIIVKHWWARTQKLTGIKLIPNYGMNFMVVFYLQQVGMLPPVMMLQKNAKPIIFEDWNTGFDEIDYEPRNNNTLYQLLGEFFEFYNNFDYDNYIVSPFVGYPVKRILFQNLSSVPDKFEFYRRCVGELKQEPIDLSASVLIQDPNLHNKNLAENLLGAREGSPFMTEFKRLAVKYREINENAFLNEVLSVQFT